MAVTEDLPIVDGGGLPASDRAPVLIGFADALSAPECVWSLLGAGVRVVAFARRGKRPALRHCHGVEIVEIAAPEDDAAAAAADVRALVAELAPVSVMPLDDAAVWVCDAASEHVPVAGPTGPQATLALDKRLQLEAAARAGLAVPPTTVIETVDELLALTSFPIQLKPAEPIADTADGSSAGATTCARTAAELAAAAAEPGTAGGRCWPSRCCRHRRRAVRHRRAGRREGVERTSPRADDESGGLGLQRLRVERRSSQRSPPRRSACSSTSAGRGMFMVELLRDGDGTVWFMELNGRPWGSMALARRAGLEYPAWALRQRVDPDFEIPPRARYRQLTCRNLGREIVHVLMVLRGPRSDAEVAWPSRRRTIRDVVRVRRRDRWYNWRPQRSALFVVDAWRTVADQLPGGLPWRRSA